MNASFKIDNVFGDNMVLQRGRPIRISGTAEKGQYVTLVLGNGLRADSIQADSSGTWVCEFEPLEAGGPYDLTISTDTCSTVLRNILIGDVWFCSGQSNMEYPLCGTDPFYHLPEGDALAAAADDPMLRLLSVPNCVSPIHIRDDFSFSPQWKPADTRDAVAPFSAVAYLFGRKLRERFPDVPIGLINSCWGGSMIEPWISRRAFEKAGLPKYLADIDSRIAKYEAMLRENTVADQENCYGGPFREWIENRFRKTAPELTALAIAKWRLPDDASPEWKPMGLKDIAWFIADVGAYWIRCKFKFPPGFRGKTAQVHVDRIDDCDTAFLDGAEIGRTSPFKKNYWILPRDYDFLIPDDGEAVHTLAFRIENHFCNGTFRGNVGIVGESGIQLSLEGLQWEGRVEFKPDLGKIGVRPAPEPDTREAFFSMQNPTTLFNAKVAPATKMNIKGAIWYQGCSNGANWEEYGALQKAMIDCWREEWRDPAMPVAITQLAGFVAHTPTTRKSDDFWKNEKPGDTIGYAPIREVQQEFLDYPFTGVATAIDEGDAFDIHPKRKEPVAQRLFHEAMRIAYGDVAALPGPRAVAAAPAADGSAVEVSFRDAGSGLRVDGGTPGPHLVAFKFADGSSDWASATLSDDGKRMCIPTGGRRDIVEVQYAFSAFAPGPFVKRKDDGLPLFPFRLPVAI